MKRLRLVFLSAVGAIGLCSIDALAQSYPSRPVRVVVPFAAGGAVDTIARIIGAKLQDSIGQPVIVEDRAGAGGTTGADVVAKAPPDGYTILMNTNGQAIAPARRCRSIRSRISRRSPNWFRLRRCSSPMRSCRRNHWANWSRSPRQSPAG